MDNLHRHMFTEKDGLIINDENWKEIDDNNVATELEDNVQDRGQFTGM